MATLRLWARSTSRRIARFTIAIAFGDGHHAAICADDADARYALSRSTRGAFCCSGAGRLRPARLASASKDGGRLMRISHNVLAVAMRTKLIRVHLLRRLRFRGELRRATLIWVVTIWCGRATWCRRRRLCWPADDRYCTACSGFLALYAAAGWELRAKTSGLMGRLTGRGFSWMGGGLSDHSGVAALEAERVG